MSVITATDFFNQLTTPVVGGSGLTRRVPFTFTSTARLIRSGKIGSLGNTYAASQNKLSQYNQLLTIEEETRPISTTIRAGADLIGSVLPIQNTNPVISMNVNPHSIKWAQGKRFSKRDTQEGSVFFHFTISGDRKTDIRPAKRIPTKSQPPISFRRSPNANCNPFRSFSIAGGSTGCIA